MAEVPVKANTSRGLRFMFDRVVDAYERGRGLIEESITADIVNRAGLTPGDIVLEIGPGTGQLTHGLINAGLHVVGVEPGHRLADRLRQRLGGSGRLEVVETTFEDYGGATKFSAIFAANSFQWLDPSISYKKAHRLLKVGAPLVTLWSFPVLADAALQRHLNETVFVDQLADLERDPLRYREQVEELQKQGLEETVQTGLFGRTWSNIVEYRESISGLQYIDLLNSFANTTEYREELLRRLRNLVGNHQTIELISCVSIRMAWRAAVEGTTGSSAVTA